MADDKQEDTLEEDAAAVIPGNPDDKAVEPEAKPEDKPADKVESKPLDTAVWGDLKDEVGNSVLNLLQDSGITTDAAKSLLYDATLKGDASKIDKAALIAAVGKDKATLILAGVENYIARNAARQTAAEAVLHTEVGGKDNWAKVVDWAKQNLSEEDIADYVDLIDAGGRKAKLAAADLKSQYEAKNGSLVDATVIPGNAPAPKQAPPPLSRAAYFQELEALHRAGRATDAAQQSLWTRREQGKKNGI